MSAAAALTLEPAADPADWARSMDEEHHAILGRVAAAGLEIMEALKAQAKGGAVVVQGDLVLAYDRAARAVRQTLMLRDRLVQALREREMARANRKASAQAGAARLIGGVIDDARADRERTEHLRAEAAERLRAEDFGDLLSRPFGEVVAGICRDLGMTPDWLKLAQDCWEVEAGLTAGPGRGSAPPADEDDGPLKVYWLDSEGRPYDPDRGRESS